MLCDVMVTIRKCIVKTSRYFLESIFSRCGIEGWYIDEIYLGGTKSLSAAKDYWYIESTLEMVESRMTP